MFDRNIDRWVTVPHGMALLDNQQDRDMLARELLVLFQMSKRHPFLELKCRRESFESAGSLEIRGALGVSE